MSAPIHRLKKDEIVKLSKNRCKAHKHSYLEHYNCYLKECPEAEERAGYFDIEASSLDADYGQVLCWCIKDGQSDKIYQSVLTKKDVDADLEDTRLLKELVETFAQFDRIYTYYGTGYDIPFVRARCLMKGIVFPEYGTLKHKDVYYTVKSKIKLSSRRLENACRQLLGSTGKTRIDAKFWRAGVRGDKKALTYIVDHCQQDVIDLERLAKVMAPFGKINSTFV